MVFNSLRYEHYKSGGRKTQAKKVGAAREPSLRGKLQNITVTPLFSIRRFFW